MRLTQKLFSLLSRPISRDPAALLAFQLGYSSAMTWQVADGFLCTTVARGPGASLDIDLSQYTVATLANFLAGEPGYAVSALTASTLRNLSALTLLDATGGNGISNGTNVYAYTDPAYALMEAYSSELQTAQATIQAAPLEMSTPTADGGWLDLLGGYYGVPRLGGEPDALYGLRIPIEALRPKCNNLAIEQAIEDYTGQVTTCTDVSNWGGAEPRYDGVITHNSAYDYNATATQVLNLFDIVTGYDAINGGDPSVYQAAIVAVVNRIRAGGNQLRSITFGGSTISDAVAPPAEALAPWTGTITLADAVAAPAEAFVLSPSGSALADSVTSAGEAALATFSYTTTYNGLRVHDGSVPYASGVPFSTPIAGP